MTVIGSHCSQIENGDAMLIVLLTIIESSYGRPGFTIVIIINTIFSAI